MTFLTPVTPKTFDPKLVMSQVRVHSLVIVTKAGQNRM